MQYQKYDANGIATGFGFSTAIDTAGYFIDQAVVAIGEIQAFFYVKNSTSDGLTYDQVVLQTYDAPTNALGPNQSIFGNVADGGGGDQFCGG